MNKKQERREIQTYDALMVPWWVPCRHPTGSNLVTHILWGHAHGGRGISYHICLAAAQAYVDDIL